MNETPLAAPSDVNDNDKLMAALSYFLTPIVGIIVLLVDTMKARPYQRYHAIQSIGLFVAELIFYVLACVVTAVCGAILTATVILTPLTICLPLLFFLPIIPNIYYAYLAYTKPGYFEIPTLSKFMVQQGWLKV